MFRRFFAFYIKVYFKLHGLKTGLLFRKLVSEANRWRKSNPAEGRSFREQLIMSSERAKNKTKDAVNYGGRKIITFCLKIMEVMADSFSDNLIAG